jgi:hypothetical protein
VPGSLSGYEHTAGEAGWAFLNLAANENEPERDLDLDRGRLLDLKPEGGEVVCGESIKVSGGGVGSSVPPVAYFLNIRASSRSVRSYYTISSVLSKERIRRTIFCSSLINFENTSRSNNPSSRIRFHSRLISGLACNILTKTWKSEKSR